MSIDLEFIAPGDAERTAYVLELVSARVDVTKIRLLDLACRTGAFAHAFAAAGSTVVGIEGKEFNFQRIPPAPNATFILGDVRRLGTFAFPPVNVTLCLGILYHLEPADAFKLLVDMREMTSNFAVVDTHVGLPHSTAVVEGKPYLGHWYSEGVPGPWSSLGNNSSFWFTPEALHDLCREAGWQVEVQSGVRWPGEPQGRHWMVLS